MKQAKCEKSQINKKKERKSKNERFSEEVGTIRERKEERKKEAGRRIAKDRQGV